MSMAGRKLVGLGGGLQLLETIHSLWGWGEAVGI